MRVKRLGIEIDLSEEHKTGCPKCIKKGRDNSRNNLHVYGLDGEGKTLGAFCWACEYTIPSQEYLDQIGEGDEEDEDNLEDVKSMGREFSGAVQAKLKTSTGLEPKGYRGISAEVSKLYRVRYQYLPTDGSVSETLYPCTENYGIVGYKVRSHPKDFQHPGPIGETGKKCDMFGQFLFKTHGSFCIITGGEHDTLAGYQMLNGNGSKFQDMAVVSGTTGEPSVHRQVKNQYDFFNQFKKIIVCMDEDEAGAEATEKVCQVLPRGKVLVMKMRYKDPNTYLDNKAGKEFVQDFWAAKPYTPAGIHASTSLYDKALGYSDLKQLSLPKFLKVAQLMFDGGLVKNELSVVFAETSIGKSIVADNMVVNWIKTEADEVVGVLSLESTVEKWSTNIFSHHLGVKLLKIKGQARKDYLARPDIKEKITALLQHEDGSPRFFVCDERGAKIDVIKEKILEMIIQMGVTILVVDVYSDLTDGLALNDQEELVSWFKKLIKEYSQLTVLMIAHTRKRTNGGSGPLTESDIMGSSTVMKSAAQTISLERDKQAENPILRNCTFVKVHKNRHFSETGPAGIIYYDPDTGVLWDLDDYSEVFPEKSREIRAALGQSDESED